ncbi:hypothetical protein FA15DRAFT_61796 [Coprinopsis marcescibilis]|uniref:G domain-containing protein n=1 Tax=Coprinopsis marcescibilis TaxID=230819 RepID=A0A5C3L6U2_COPMA|nr:hypothetical protein FA15DRAFT_61796 [Coprinopsis marcescibilis]
MLSPIRGLFQRAGGELLPDPKRDVLILLLGPTGSGRSTFIKEYTNKAVKVGKHLLPCTDEVIPYEATSVLGGYGRLDGRRLLFVDTPGFDGEEINDLMALTKICKWLDERYDVRINVAGILYFTDITLPRMTVRLQINQNICKILCGETSLQKVILVTSQWDGLRNEDIPTAEIREMSLLKDDRVRVLIDAQAVYRRIQHKPEDPSAIIDHVLKAFMNIAPNPTTTPESVHNWLEQLEAAFKELVQRLLTFLFTRPANYRADDILILLVGQCGAGKSTFIKEYAKKDVPIGHGQASCTHSMDCYEAVLPDIQKIESLSGRRLFLVDTPGFNDPDHGDERTLGLMLSWIQKCYNLEDNVAGIIFLHDIGEKRMTDIPIVDICDKLCGQSGSFKRVTMATSQWDNDVTEAKRKRESELKDKHWNDILDRGARYQRISNKPEDPNKIIKHILQTFASVVSASQSDPNAKQRTQTKWIKQLGFKNEKEFLSPFKVPSAPKPGDIVILVIGEGGVGKSTFVANYTGQGVLISAGFEPVTTSVRWYEATRWANTTSSRRVFLVDTPPLPEQDDEDGVNSLTEISVFLARCYHARIQIAGVVSLWDVSYRHWRGASILRTVMELCGPEFMTRVVIAIRCRQHDSAYAGPFQQAESLGARLEIFGEGGRDIEYCQRIVNRLLEFGQQEEMQLMNVQKEIVDMGRPVLATSAGQSLRCSAGGLAQKEVSSPSPSPSPGSRTLKSAKKVLRHWISRDMASEVRTGVCQIRVLMTPVVGIDRATVEPNT